MLTVTLGIMPASLLSDLIEFVDVMRDDVMKDGLVRTEVGRRGLWEVDKVHAIISSRVERQSTFCYILYSILSTENKVFLPRYYSY